SACLPTDYGLPCLLLVGWFAVRTDLPVLTLPACPPITDYPACSLSDGLTLLFYNQVKKRKTTFCVCRAFGFLLCLYLKTLQYNLAKMNPADKEALREELRAQASAVQQHGE